MGYMAGVIFGGTLPYQISADSVGSFMEDRKKSVYASM
jgi:hypothetical protein